MKVMGGVTGFHFTGHAGEVTKRWSSTFSASLDLALVSSCYFVCVLILNYNNNYNRTFSLCFYICDVPSITYAFTYDNT